MNRHRVEYGIAIGNGSTAPVLVSWVADGRRGRYVSSERAGGGAGAGAPFRFKTAEDTHRYVSESGVRKVKLGVADVDGILRGKYVSREKFLGILEKGFSFCDVIVGWDSNDQLYDNVAYTGWHTG